MGTQGFGIDSRCIREKHQSEGYFRQNKDVCGMQMELDEA